MEKVLQEAPIYKEFAHLNVVASLIPAPSSTKSKEHVRDAELISSKVTANREIERFEFKYEQLKPNSSNNSRFGGGYAGCPYFSDTASSPRLTIFPIV